MNQTESENKALLAGILIALADIVGIVFSILEGFKNPYAISDIILMVVVFSVGFIIAALFIILHFKY